MPSWRWKKKSWIRKQPLFQRDRSGQVCVTRPLIIQCEPNNVLWLPAEMEDQLPSAVREQVYPHKLIKFPFSKKKVYPHGLFEWHKQRIYTNDLLVWVPQTFFIRGDTNIGHLVCNKQRSKRKHDPIICADGPDPMQFVTSLCQGKVGYERSETVACICVIN